MTSLNPFLTDFTAEYCGGKGLELGLCHNMQYEKEVYCNCPVDFASPAYRFYPQAPYSSALPPPDQYMSDMEGKNKFTISSFTSSIVSVPYFSSALLC